MPYGMPIFNFLALLLLLGYPIFQVSVCYAAIHSCMFHSMCYHATLTSMQDDYAGQMPYVFNVQIVQCFYILVFEYKKWSLIDDTCIVQRYLYFVRCEQSR